LTSIALGAPSVSATWRRDREAWAMTFISRGFRRKAGPEAPGGRVPPGQYLTQDFPVLSAGPTPHIEQQDWRFEVLGGGEPRGWSWDELLALPAEDIDVDIHCVTKWSKLDTRWKGVPVAMLLEGFEVGAHFAMIHSYGGYTTNLPLADLAAGKAWVAYEYDGEPLEPEHGGPARLLVPHLYLWKSAKWVRAIELRETDGPGFWERYGYHDYGDPWKEQRYAGD
jgi:DMSO/TMAO reductase YedYZ molybdopterin-dependent catalytic subunit